MSLLKQCILIYENIISRRSFRETYTYIDICIDDNNSREKIYDDNISIVALLIHVTRDYRHSVFRICMRQDKRLLKSN